MYACAYNIDNLYNTRRIYPPGIVKIVYIIAMRALYTCTYTENKEVVTLLLSVWICITYDFILYYGNAV